MKRWNGSSGPADARHAAARTGRRWRPGRGIACRLARCRWPPIGGVGSIHWPELRFHEPGARQLAPNARRLDPQQTRDIDASHRGHGSKTTRSHPRRAQARPAADDLAFGRRVPATARYRAWARSSRHRTGAGIHGLGLGAPSIRPATWSAAGPAWPCPGLRVLPEGYVRHYQATTTARRSTDPVIA